MRKICIPGVCGIIAQFLGSLAIVAAVDLIAMRIAGPSSLLTEWAIDWRFGPIDVFNTAMFLMLFRPDRLDHSPLA